MDDIDYEKIGLIAGIEIHQQLDTKKLFCRCPSMIRDDKSHMVVKRWLRASAGETGGIDQAAKAEMQKQKYYLYEAYEDTTCLVELDEEPPHPMNRDALDVVLQVCGLLRSDVVDTIQIMRKVVVDGSNTSGFQRTALVGLDGNIEVDGLKVKIPTICIEEDAAKIVEQADGYSRYNLSKLGIPLIELCTDPDMRTPDQVRDVAAYLGMVLRSTGHVKRGIGTIRQDVNVSVKDGARIEIKGAQDLKLIPKWVENEARRQLALLAIRDILPSDLDIKKEFIDISQLFAGCDSKIIKSCFDNKGIILAMKLPLFAGLIGKELIPNRRLGTEFSDYAKMAAGVGGIFHSDELPKYGISEDHVNNIKDALQCQDNDAFVLVASSKDRSELALDVVYKRAMACKDGVPMEVRKPLPDGNTSYMRPMPGAERMYPETDCRIVIPDMSLVKLPKLLVERKEEIKSAFGLTDDLTNAIFKNQLEAIFFKITERCRNIKPSYICEVLLSLESDVKRKHNLDISDIDEKHYEEILLKIDAGKIPKEALIDIFAEIKKTGTYNESKYAAFSEEDLKEKIKVIISKNKGAPFNALIGKVMAELRGKADGKLIAELTKKYSGG
ncbi:Glu-tRNA(Gln) amidotransferase GatDE subunit E [Candidatus Woesearchaeota archaeon CG11_big_fil_rev_8_21_14_0_20_43_8]|nr:MAG: Glu-tRNA(Gln) amidotransferase GatDE subunit E [Candidatus Woesearchaeota archaeon CG11_big_fil_rev_8_21_14_0_20_43_8]